MKVIYNSIIPFKGFLAVNLFGFLFVRKENKHKLTPTVFNHEAIHTAQMKELLYIGFYIIYLLEWIVRLFCKGNAYKNTSFEKEAYNYQYDYTYLDNRKYFAMWR